MDVWMICKILGMCLDDGNVLVIDVVRDYESSSFALSSRAANLRRDSEISTE